MNLNRRMERLEQRAKHGVACRACGAGTDPRPTTFKVAFTDGAKAPQPGDACDNCGRPRVIRIQFDRAG